MNMARKYAAVFVIGLKNELAYKWQVLMNTLFLVIILYIFVELWTSTFASASHTVIAGFTAQSVVWYLAVTESIILGTPRLVASISQEVIQGDIAYRLTKPLSYLGFHYFTYLAQALTRITINLAVASLVALMAVGPLTFTVFQGLIIVVSVVTSVSLSFCLYGVVALSCLWIEDARGIELVVSRFVMILGGMMIPLSLFPPMVSRICLWLPFQVIAYGPARAVVSFVPKVIVGDLQTAGMWLFLFCVLLIFVYRLGVRKLHVQGG